MRSIEEIGDDIKVANDKNDVAALRTLAEEMSMVGSVRANAVAARTRGLVCQLAGEFNIAIEHMNSAMSLFQEEGDRAGMASVTGNLGNVYFSLGHYQEALDHYQRAVALYEGIGDRIAFATFIGNIGGVHNHTGKHEEALSCYQRALSIHQELGDLHGAARIVGNMGNVFYKTGNYQKALEHYHRALEMHHEAGNVVNQAQVTGNIGIVYRSTGCYAEALEYSFRARALYEQAGNTAGIAGITASIGNIYAVTGSPKEALEFLNEAIAMAQSMGDRHLMAVLQSNLGSRRGDAGEIEAALEHFLHARTLYEEAEDPDGVSRVVGFITTALLDLGREDEAIAQLDELATMPLHDPRVRAHYHAARGTIAERQLDLDTALTEIRQALAVSVDAGVRSQEAEYHARLRDLARKMNDFDEYVRHNTEYIKVHEEIRGMEATQRLTMLQAERKMEGERRERDKERALLHSALPKSIADRMIRGEVVSGDHFEHAAVMFLDIVSFTSNTSGMPPSEVVKMLEKIFKVIDSICDEHCVIKIKTIGDSYMCFCGDADASTNALSIMHVALDVMKGAFTWPNGEPVRFRAGIHIGPATAGVIGNQRLQYDVWGDTVNVANRMESTGEPGKIQVSEMFASFLVPHFVRNDNSILEDIGERNVIPSATRNEEPGTWHLAPRGEIEIKGKGPMLTYWLGAP